MAKIGVFDLCSFFWTVAGTRKRGEDPYGLALQVLRYIRSCAEKVGVEDVIFGADGPSGRSFRRSVCADYKAGREAKDPEMVAELDALTAALVGAGFTVVRECLMDPDETPAIGAPDVDGNAILWFEGDDVVASFAVTILKDPDAEVVVGSNDWDLAPLLAFPKVRIFTTRGEERTAADVKKEFGVEPLMLPQLKALAGDSDGYKPFPGLEKGKPGIGDKTAAAILEKFGSAEAAVRAALADLPATAFEGLPSRTAALLKAGGEAALAMGLTCAKLRTDAPVPTDVDFGEWADVERALLDRQKAQQSEPRPEVAAPPADAAKAFREAAHAQITKDAALKANEEDVERKAEARLASKIGPEGVEEMRQIAEGRIGAFAGEGAVSDLIGRARDPKGVGVSEIAPAPRYEYADGKTSPITFEGDALAATEGESRQPISVRPEEFIAEREPGERPTDRKRRRSKAAVTPPIPTLAAPGLLMPGDLEAAQARPSEPTVFVLLTEAEFIALAPLPALAAAGLLTPPEEYAERFEALLTALREGLFRPCDGVFIGSVPEACKDALAHLSDIALNHGFSGVQWSTFVEQLHVLPRLTDIAKYGGKLARV